MDLFGFFTNLSLFAPASYASCDCTIEGTVLVTLSLCSVFVVIHRLMERRLDSPRMIREEHLTFSTVAHRFNLSKIACHILVLVSNCIDQNSN